MWELTTYGEYLYSIYKMGYIKYGLIPHTKNMFINEMIDYDDETHTILTYMVIDGWDVIARWKEVDHGSII